MTSQKALVLLLGALAALLAACVALVAVVDPFLQYHLPLASLKDNYIYEVEYAQYWAIGEAKNTPTQSVLVGSSMSELIDAKQLGGAVGLDCLQLSISAGRPDIYARFIDASMRKNNLDTVFYELYLPHWDTAYPNALPEYLYNQNPFDDVRYLLNKDVMLRSLDILLGVPPEEGTLLRKNIADTAQSEGMDGIDYLSQNYVPNSTPIPPEAVEQYAALAGDTLDKQVRPVLAQYPDTRFVFIMPPASILTMVDYDRGGALEGTLAAWRGILAELLTYPNVEIHMFSDAENFVCDLNNYFDAMHYFPAGAQLVCDGVASGQYRLTPETLDKRLTHLQSLAESFQLPFLAAGFEGDEVLAMQQNLAALGYSPELDGFYGAATTQAVLAFQTDNTLPATGVARPETLVLLAEQTGQGSG